MPPLETTDRYDDAVYWPAAGRDRKGNVVVGDPVELKVRWSGKRTYNRNAGGGDQTAEQMPVDAEVVLDRVILVGSQMWNGTLAEWTAGGNTGAADDVMQVTSFNSAFDLRGRETRYRASLMFLRNLKLSGS